MLSKIYDKTLFPNFSLKEILHGYIEEKIPEELEQNIFPTLTILQKIRATLNVPIIINSTYRSREHNLLVGGEDNSLHLSFNAIDFVPTGYSSAEISHLANEIMNRKFVSLCFFNFSMITITPNIMGVGSYRNFIHIDTRGLLGRHSPAMWFEK